MFGKKGKETKQDKQEQARQRSNTAPTSSSSTTKKSLNDSGYNDTFNGYGSYSAASQESTPSFQFQNDQNDMYRDDRRFTVSAASTEMTTFGNFEIPVRGEIKPETGLSLDNVRIIEVKPPVPAPTLKLIPETPPASPKESKDATSSVPAKPRRLAPPLGPPPKDPPPLPGTQKKIEVKKTGDSVPPVSVSAIPPAPPLPPCLLKYASAEIQQSQKVFVLSK